MNRTLLKETTSRCMVCDQPAPGVVYTEEGRVYLERNCEEHGPTRACISSDERLYFQSVGAVGCGSGCGCEAPAPANHIEQLATCIALIEIVDSCNLSCPVCFADSPKQGVPDAVPFNEFVQRVEGVVQRKGHIEILQLSGGEPTIHPEFFRLLEWAQAHPKIDYILINTNGVRIARDDAFAAELERVAARGKLQVYLQFDGPGPNGQQELRGADLRKVRTTAIERLGGMQPQCIPTTLAMTVIPQNLDQVWAAVEFGVPHPHVRGVAYQPIFGSGRVAPGLAEPRLNAADIVLELEAQSNGLFGVDDITPLPCGDPNCALIGYLLKLPEGVVSAAKYVDFEQVQGFLKDRLAYDLEDLAQCGCEAEPLGELLKQFELKQEHTFRIFIKPFMDSASWGRPTASTGACTHVIRPDGKLDSFCRYYAQHSCA